MTYSHNYKSPLGPIVLASDGKNITGLWFRGQKYFGGALGDKLTPTLNTLNRAGSNSPLHAQRSVKLLGSRGINGECSKFPFAPRGKGGTSRCNEVQAGDGAGCCFLPIFTHATEWLDKYFAGKNPLISDLPLAPAGTDFRKMVWEILTKIPKGTVTTYGDIAQQVAARMGCKTMSAQAIGGAVGHNPISIIIPCHRVVGTNASLTGYVGGMKRKIKLLEIENVDISKYTIP